ncbi:glycosyltransferase family 4 protein [Steroidobacter sp. S1-65]|uniref:Glycosyltransferase family 4 protein n=1 Tax=Steroidobacter gossypii TaxID=2805490 RepID=A0ABS1WXK1_9GAMM|nr:glycosyltransferase family 4 protein [Steroidobacter gossypii]MBM0105711.1 glycosyltransferase family 4 protein [Steroidobacter gossypii]
MKIAQVAPLIESVPPRLYGGTERIVSYLTEELIRQGHEVSLFASGDSRTSARLIATVPKALRLDPNVRDYLPYTVLQLEQLRQYAHTFDIIHFHGDYVHLPVARSLGMKGIVTTMHGRLDLPDYQTLFAEFDDAPLVSISDHQRLPLPSACWVGTVYHGLPAEVCAFTEQPRGDYVAFLGRISPEKRPDRAIEIARQAGMRIKIAAKVDDADRAYFHERIEPLLSQPHVEFIGEIGEHQKSEFLGNAAALLFPIDWPEPFGLVMIEAMSCGTPCIAWRAGSVPEIIEEGVTGYIVDSIDAAAERLRHVGMLKRSTVREKFEQRFSAARMAADYVQIYRRLLASQPNRIAA